MMPTGWDCPALLPDVHSERETSIASPVQNGIMVAVNANTR